MATRKVNVRANTAADAKKFAKQLAKLSTMDYSGEKVGMVKLSRKHGLAGGVKMYTVTMTRRKTKRYTTGKKKGQLRPAYN